jgi:two-component system sensor histidine kinase ChiS
MTHRGGFHIVGILLLFSGSALLTQPRVALPNINVERIGAEHGLSHSTVTDIIRDRRGFIWIATMDGLNRFDGYTCKVYRHDPNDPTSLSSSFIHGILEDHEGRLWVTTRDGGLNRFDPATERAQRFLPIPNDTTSINDRLVGPLYYDSKGRLWIGGNTALNLFHPETSTFTRFKHDPDNPASLSHSEVSTLYEDRQGRFWVGTIGGLNVFDAERRTFRRFLHDPANPATLSHNFIRALMEDGRGIFWISAGGMLNTLDRETGEVDRSPLGREWPALQESRTLGGIFEDSRGNLWFGTGGDGLFLLDHGGKRLFHFRYDPASVNSLSHNNVHVRFEDEQGTLWLPTWGGGVNKIVPLKQKFHHVVNNPNDPNSLSNNFVFAVFEDSRGALWIGTGGGGLNRYDAARGTFKAYLPRRGDESSISDASVWAIVEDRDGMLWVGTDNGLNLFDPAQERFTRYFHDPDDPSSISSNIVKSLYIDRQGRLWAGTNADGLCRLDRTTGRWTRWRHDPEDARSIGAEQVWAITEDDYGNIWVGTFLNGLSKLDPATGRFTRFEHDPRNPNSLSFNDVRAIHPSTDGTLWLATYGGGLNAFAPSTGRFTRYSVKNGLPNDFLYGILEDGDGNLWISSNRGISKFDRGSTSFRNYTTEDGLQADEFNTGAFFRSRRGELFFGGVNGLNRFHPTNIRENTRVPPIAITNFRVFDKDVRLDTAIIVARSIRLEHHQNFFSFEFAALDFIEPSKNQYAYKLEEFDPEWIESGTRRYASYTNLDPGEYVFRVKGSNNDGVWNEEGVSVHVTIVPPFWMTAWFRVSVGLLAVGIVGGAARYVSTRRLRRQLQEMEKQRALQEERERISRDLHDHAGAQLTNIISGIELAGKYSKSSQSKTRRLLSTLQLDARTSITQLRETIWALRTDAMSVQQFAESLETYARRQLKYRRTTTFQLACRCDRDTTLTPIQVLNLFRIFQEAFTNALKHSGGGLVETSIVCDDGSLALTLENGVATSKTTGRAGSGGKPPRRPGGESGGQGIPNMERRARELNGTLSVAPRRDGGMRVTVEIPLSDQLRAE